MTEATATFEVRRNGPASVVDIRGDVTAASEEVLMIAYSAAADSRAIILNFSELQYMNSGGIGLLVTLLVRANRRSQQLLAYGLSDHYRQIFELTRLDEAVGIHDDEAAALAAAGRGREHERQGDGTGAGRPLDGFHGGPPGASPGAATIPTAYAAGRTEVIGRRPPGP